jgi:cobalt-zinc-cadmium efflux system membrane fusion protein
MTPVRITMLLLLSCAAACEAKGGTEHEGEGEGEHEGHAHGDTQSKGEHDEHGHGEPEAEGAHGEDHGDEVEVSPEAAERAGIRLGKAERRALAGGSAIPGEVQFDPSSTAHVGPLVAGRITRVTVAIGDRVKRGQLLGTVASSDASAARSQLEQSRARLAAAESVLQRQKQLSTEGIGAQRTLVEAEAQVGELRAEVDGLRRQLSVFGSGASGELALKAPIDGVVVDVHATMGETATPDAPAFIITDPTKVAVRGNVPELEISRVTVGSAVMVRLHAFPDLAMPGTISYIAPALDEKTRSLPIRVSLTTPDPRLRSGLFGSIELIGGALDERVVVVPTDALATIDGQQVVFVPADEPNTYTPRSITVGRRAGGLIEVRAGLEEGAPLALSGAFTLKSALKSGEISDGHAH